MAENPVIITTIESNCTLDTTAIVLSARDIAENFVNYPGCSLRHNTMNYRLRLRLILDPGSLVQGRPAQSGEVCP